MQFIFPDRLLPKSVDHQNLTHFYLKNYFQNRFHSFSPRSMRD
uniref:Uncharacterized protein n=1 Tax=Anguilla anguilla TaxID=7936 RepID=A0A0E9R9P7_ANGAN